MSQHAPFHRPEQGRVHLHKVLGVVGHDRNPVAGHRVTSGAIPLKIGNVRRGVDELEPLDDAEQHEPAKAKKWRGIRSAIQRWLNSQTTSAKSIRPLPL